MKDSQIDYDNFFILNSSKRNNSKNIKLSQPKEAVFLFLSFVSIVEGIGVFLGKKVPKFEILIRPNSANVTLIIGLNHI